MTKIVFQNFSFRYRNLKEPTLKNITLDINSGEKVLIAGQSGSGKSTLMHCVNGLVPFAYDGEISGKLFLDGIEPYEESLFKVSKIAGTILQDQDSQFIGLTVGEDVAFVLENEMTPLKEMQQKVSECLATVDMLDYINHSPYELSGGQRQRVSLAGVLSSQSEILLFDEPLANLDPVSGKNIISLIDDLHKETGKTILIVEHRIEDVLERSVDRVIVIDQGEIIFNGKPCELLRTDTLKNAGLREPLYVEAIKYSELKLEDDHKLDDINNCDHDTIKESVTNWFEDKLPTEEDFDTDKVLSVKDINFSFVSNTKVIDNVSFDIRKGEIVSILGNNGAGKSTLSNLITGILKPDSGEIVLDGEVINNLSVKAIGDKIGYVMQNPNNMTVKHMLRDEVTLGLRAGLEEADRFNFLNRWWRAKSKVCENTIETKFIDTIKKCKLYGYRNWPLSSLSYGQKRRASIASVLAREPRVLILDEPTAGQDYSNYSEFMKFMNELSGYGIAIILITHDMHLALEYTNRSIVMSDGKKIADDTPANIFSQEDIVKKANLRETSLGKLADVIGIENKHGFIQHFIDFDRERKR
ncbi:MAG: ATP-binding cassette domain-containing protein [Lentisphaerae bacterium]|nr:ATP-binding cassette domain-containing protein [Lentisphaerota bacterium]MCP4101362.1 ATP-binding cassette domain-containing protein [Lentisphaerota bacterium]